MEHSTELSVDRSDNEAQDGLAEAQNEEEDGVESGPAHVDSIVEQHAAKSTIEDHCSQLLKLQEKARRKAERQAEAEEQWKQQEQERLRNLEEQQKAKKEVEARKRRRVEELQGIRAKLETLKVEKHEMVSQLKQVLLTEDSEKARAAAVAALEEGEVLVEPLPGVPHLASMQSMGSSAYSAVSPAQAASTALSTTPPALPLIQTQGSAAAALPLHMSQPLGSVGPGRPHIALHATHSGRLPPHLAAGQPSGPPPPTPFGVSSLPPHLQK
ncbi:g1709 [Coccomyxa elongata]